MPIQGCGRCGSAERSIPRERIVSFRGDACDWKGSLRTNKLLDYGLSEVDEGYQKVIDTLEWCMERSIILWLY